MGLTLEQEGQISHFSTERKLQFSVWSQPRRSGNFGFTFGFAFGLAFGLAIDFAGRFNFCFATGFEFISLRNMRATPNRFKTRRRTPKISCTEKLLQRVCAFGHGFAIWCHCHLTGNCLFFYVFFDLYGYVWTSNVWSEMPPVYVCETQIMTWL